MDLPEEIIEEILSRLPVKTLLRFTCVSKRWRFIIKSDLEFARSHFKLASEHKTLTHRLLYSGFSPEQFLSIELDMPASSFREEFSYKVKFPFLRPGGEVSLLGSCNGLVFLIVPEVDKSETFYACNPATGFFMQLPSPAGLVEEYYRSSFACYGVGYVSATEDYKVLYVRVYYDEDGEEEEEVIQVLSLRDQRWKRIESPRETQVGGCSCWTLSNEALHWLLFGDPDQICAFDLGKEEFRTMLLPNFFQDGKDYTVLGVDRGGCLCVSRHEIATCDSIDFWVMREYGVHDTWTKLFTFKSTNPGKHLWCVRQFLVMERCTFGWNILFGLIRLDHREEENEKHGLLGIEDHYICRTAAHYEESLLWIHI